jgi:uncharacterized Zn finger protein (UPF0148 family)
MRVECESCRELVAASFARNGDAVRATCPVCAHAMVVTLAVAATDAAPAASAETGGASAGAGGADRAQAGEACPKCGASRRRDAAACPTCGLAVARMASFHNARDAAVPLPVHKAWARAIAAWDDPVRHEEVLQQVAAHNCYAWAAARYRTRGRDAIAERQLDRLRRAAEATLLAGATVRRDAIQPYRTTRGVLGFLIAAVVAGLFYATLRRPPTPPRTPGLPSVSAPLVPGHPVSPSSVR